MDISKLKLEDQYLINYLNLNILRSEGKIDPNGLRDLYRIASTEPRAQNLEMMYNNVMAKRARIEDYNALYEQYKNELSQAVGATDNKQPNTNLLYFNSLVDYLNLEAKKSIEPLSKEETERFMNYINSVSEAKVLEDAHTKLYNDEINVDEFKEIREKYKALALFKLKENGRTDVVTIQDGKLYEPKEESKLSKELEGMIKYFNLSSKREAEGLTDDEANEISVLSVKLQNAMTLEEAKKRVEGGKIPAGAYKLLRNKYKNELAEKLAAVGVNINDVIDDDSNIDIKPKEEPKVEEASQNSKELTEDEKGLVRYLELENKSELTKKEQDEIAVLKIRVQKVMTLEEAKKRVKNGSIPKEVHESLHNKYKNELIESIKSKGLNVEDYIKDKVEEPVEVKPIEVKEEPASLEEVKTEEPTVETKVEEPIKEEIPVEDNSSLIKELQEENKELKEKLASLESKLKGLLQDIQ